MDKEFIDILKKLVKERGKDALANYSRCKNILRDYTQNEFKIETRFILLAVEAGAVNAIEKAADLADCKKVQIRELQKEHGFAPEIAADIVDTLALVLRNDKTVTKPEMPNYGKNIADELYDSGYAYLEKCNYELAIKDFDEVINLDESYVEAYKKRGIAYFEKGCFDQAIEDFDKAIQLNPCSSDAYFNRGVAYVRKDCYDEAIADFDKEISFRPGKADSYLMRGRTYARKGDFKKAIEDIKIVLQIIPNHAEAQKFLSALSEAQKAGLSIHNGKVVKV